MNTIKYPLGIAILKKVYLNNMLKVPFPIFTDTEGLPNLTSTVY